MKTAEERRSQLETRRAELIERMEAVEAELETHNTRDWEDAATEREQDEVLEGMGLSAQAEVVRIDAALDRIASGEYGHCAVCGTRISEERLDLLPFTPFCRNCAR
ncbi:MAG: TraR/DksA family transcriptional regulator [Rhodobacteraceae bacterium]|nr:TraR/DksA family transcriptional regulator [Paracoccaceae bacterium]